jgi:TonB-linked SusC/RagA family outer membrane protein
MNFVHWLYALITPLPCLLTGNPECRTGNPESRTSQPGNGTSDPKTRINSDGCRINYRILSIFLWDNLNRFPFKPGMSDGKMTSRFGRQPQCVPKGRLQAALKSLPEDPRRLNASGRWLSTKTVLAMKLTILLLTIGFLHVSASGVSQTVTFSGRNVSLENVFASVKKQTGYVFFFSDAVAREAKPVSIQAVDMPLDEFLNTVLKDQPLKYTFQNKTIIISRSFSERITLSEKDAPLKTVLQKIGDQSGYEFFFKDDGAKDLRVSISVKDQPIEEVLPLCFKETGFGYEIVSKIIVVRKKNESIPYKNNISTSGQITKTVNINGSVYNDAGQPLAGANVTIKETQKGTTTNARGEFQLQDVPVNSTLIISFIGYARQQKKVIDDTNLKFYLSITKNELDKVVIQAYGTTTQRLATGNIATVTAEQIEKQPVMNPLLALQGQVAGLEVTPTSGYASGPIKVEIRGRNSISSNTTSDPLYIIDGVPLTVLDVAGAQYPASAGFIQNGFGGPAGGQSPFFSLNSSDIESIEILKDADATAIYGSRAANGVILITTKKGKAGKTQFNMNVSEGISSVTRHWNMLNTSSYLQMRREAFNNAGQTATVGNAPDLFLWDTTRYTDWQKYLWGNTGKWTNVQLGLSGGDARTVFRISAGYKRSTDITTVSGANQNASISFSLTNHTANQRFSISFNAIYSYSETNLINLPNGAAVLPPDAPGVFDKNGNLNYEEWDSKQGNFLFGNLLQPYESKTNFLTSSVNLNYNLIKNIVLRANIGYNIAQANQTYFTTIASQDPAYDPTGNSTFGNNNNQNWLIEPQAEYNGFVGKGKLNIFAGGSIQKTTTDGLQVGGSGYTNDALLRTISNAPSVFSSDNYGQYKYAAVFGRIGYNWENKYILNLNARRDGSSRFGPGNQFGNFGSVGATWILSEEKWISDNLPTWFSFIKIRGSYGTTGGDAGSDYAYLTRWSGNNLVSYNGIAPLVPLQHANTDYHWQVNRKLEGAIDIGLLKDRIMLNIAYYRDRCDNQLVAFPTPQFSGFTSVIANSPASVQNSGLEYLLNAKIINNKNFSWYVTFNTSFNRNKLLAYPNLALSPYSNTYRIGQPLNITWLLHSIGVDPQTGQYAFQDKNHDGVVNIDYSILPGTGDDDRYAYNLTPKLIGGLTNNFRYKKVGFSFLLYFKKQVGQNAVESTPLPGSMYNIPAYIFKNRWQKPGDITNVAKLSTVSSTANSYFSNSDGIYSDASFIRLSNLSLTYNLIQSVANKIGMASANIFVNVNNGFTITKYKGLDPEVQNFGGMPPARTIVCGINCNF